MTNANSSTCCLQCGVEKTAENTTKNKNRPDGRNAYCKACAKKKQAASYLKHIDSRKVRAQEAYENKKDEYKGRAARWAGANKEKRRDITKNYVARNKEARAATQKREREKNPGYYRAHFKMRQTRKRQALSAWADLGAIEALYVECSRISKETGIKHHVDHYYPLTSDIVCGLHNQFNLRIIPAYENLLKHNHFPDED